MNKREKEILQAQLDSEKAVLKEIEKQYEQALRDINDRIRLIVSDDLTQSKIYQLNYQKALRAQVKGILEKLHSDEYATIQQFLNHTYTDAFVGTAYNLAGQGIPLMLPVNQASAIKAIMTDSKISKGLYDSLGVDVNGLKKSISAEITRGIASGMPLEDIARNISNATKAPYSRAKSIVYTEGHRVQQASTFDAQQAAKTKGASVVKQWDASLDGRTRETHRELDGQIREVDEPFEANGQKAMFPGDFGDPAEDCNCRCVSLTRAKWALDEAELQTMKDRAEFWGLDKTASFDDYKSKYLSATQATEFQQSGRIAKPPKEYDGVFDDFAELNLTKKESEALTSLWSASKSSGFEYGAVIANGVVSKPVTSKMPNAVKIPLDDFGTGLTVLHSHTNATPPSITDFKRLLDGKVDKIGVIGYNGDAFMAYVGNGETPSLKDFEDIANGISRQVDSDLFDEPNFFDWSVEERKYMATREQAFRIARYFGWTLEGGRIDVE